MLKTINFKMNIDEIKRCTYICTKLDLCSNKNREMAIFVKNT